MKILAERGFATRVTLEQASSAAAALRARCAAYAARVLVAIDETGAARTGMYLANGSSDTPYVVQERDRLLLRRQELDTVAVDARTRLAELDTRIGAEQRRLNRVAAYVAMLPGNSVIWAVAASPGASVAPGSALIDLADCRHRFVEVTLPERRIEALVPGREVKVRLVGADNWQTGHIIRAVGAAARRDVAMVAASDAADHDPHALTVEVALPLAPGSAVSRRCDIGRLAEVRIGRWST